VWLDSQLTLKVHHATRLKEGKEGDGTAPPLTGQMRLSPVNCRKAMTACAQSVATFGAELWWKGDHVRGTVGQADELQLLANQEARATTGCFRRTSEPCQWNRDSGRRWHSWRTGSGVWSTAAQAATGRPGARNCRSADRDRTEAYKCPRLRRKHGEHSSARGTWNPRRGTDPGGGDRG
jgi:hypothetical protein